MKNSYNFSTTEDELLEKCLTEIKTNTQLSAESLRTNTNLKKVSQSLLEKITNTLQTHSLPDMSKKTFEPVLKLWHQLLNEQTQQGLSTKDTALLMYALKTSLRQLPETSERHKMNQLLDILGILTFEMYTVEKEKQINSQKNHIHYLQSKELLLNGTIIGNSPPMRAVFKAIGLVLENDITVLLEGESGTGKDVIANVIHQNSNRKKKPFVAINCSAIPKDLIESELFGHEKGSFTGAEEKKLGKFELAHDGTLFLDEIGEMPIELQVKLLRTLQNREIERVGGKMPIKINVRIIAATNQNLKKQVEKKQFRLDLYYRLNVFPIVIPPIRERKEDILPLSHFFLEKYAQQFKIKKPILTEDAQHFLLNQQWPGNARELENIIQRALILAQNSPITSTILELKPGETHSLKALQSADSVSLPQAYTIQPLEDVEKNAIIQALTLEKGNIKKVAEKLEISRTTLYNKLTKFKIDTTN